MDYKSILKKIDKYYLFTYKNSKISLVGNNSNKKEILSNFKNKFTKKINKDKYQDYQIILLKIKLVPYNPKQPIKMVFGPIKVEINFFQISTRGAIKTNKYETRNNHLFYTTNFLEKNKISKKDFKKIIHLAVNNKLEKRLLAPKTIDQILQK